MRNDRQLLATAQRRAVARHKAFTKATNMRRTINPTHATTIIADCHGIQDSDIHPTIKEELHRLVEYRKAQMQEATWRVIPPAEAASKLQAREDDFQHSPENPEPKIPWMTWKIGSKLRATRAIATYCSNFFTAVAAGQYLILSEATRANIHAIDAAGNEHMIDGSNCCYLELVQEPKQQTPNRLPVGTTVVVRERMRATLEQPGQPDQTIMLPLNGQYIVKDFGNKYTTLAPVKVGNWQYVIYSADESKLDIVEV